MIGKINIGISRLEVLIGKNGFILRGNKFRYDSILERFICGKWKI
jgi:hypothetical protein